MRVSRQTRTVVPESAQQHPVQLAVVVIRELWDEGSPIHQSITGKYCALDIGLLPSLTVSHFEILHFCYRSSLPLLFLWLCYLIGTFTKL